MDWYKDRGAKKHGWKNTYHKEEWGDKKKYHDVWRYLVLFQLNYFIKKSSIFISGIRTGRESGRVGKIIAIIITEINIMEIKANRYLGKFC